MESNSFMKNAQVRSATLIGATLLVGVTCWSFTRRIAPARNQGLHTLYQNGEQKSFEARVYEEICSVNTHGIDPGFILAIAVHETGNGTGRIYLRGHNLFSIRGARDFRRSKPMDASRHIIYENELGSLFDFIEIITTHRRYKMGYQAALKHDSNAFFDGLQQGGYAEDPRYAEKLKRTYKELIHEKVVKRIEQCESVDGNTCHITPHKRLSKRKHLGNRSVTSTRNAGSKRSKT